MQHMPMDAPETADDFARITEDFKQSVHFRKPMLFAIGTQQATGTGTIASARFPVVNGPDQNLGTAAIVMNTLGIDPHGVQTVNLTIKNLLVMASYFRPFRLDGQVHPNMDVISAAIRRVNRGADDIVATFIFDDVDPQGVEDSTLKLYSLSKRFFKPNGLNLSKIFTKLPNVAWINDTPYDEDDIAQKLMDAAFDDGSYAPYMVDKFPLYIHRINAVKMKVRITDQHKVRLGAYLGEGTTLMPGASYVNFNAGSEGESMIEGRISSSAFIGRGTDIGGGASMLGVLSGGNDVPISTGRNCLLEANSVLGLPIGDAVIIAADTAVLAGSLVRVNVPTHPRRGDVVKASELVGINAVTFRRNDRTGEMEVVRTSRNEAFARKLEDGESILNADLHQHN